MKARDLIAAIVVGVIVALIVKRLSPDTPIAVVSTASTWFNPDTGKWELLDDDGE